MKKSFGKPKISMRVSPVGSRARRHVPPELERLGTHLRQARMEYGGTLQVVAQKAGMHFAELSKIEAGHRLPTLSQAVNLSRVLDVPLQTLLSGEVRAAETIEEIALELRHFGIVDLIIPRARTPGAFRKLEELVVLVLKAEQPSGRLVEAVPALLAWNLWEPDLLEGFAKAHRGNAAHRAAWLADIALTIDKQGSFPGGCCAREQMQRLRRQIRPPESADDLGYSREDFNLPPVSRRWNVEYPADLNTFRARAQKLSDLRQDVSAAAHQKRTSR